MFFSRLEPYRTRYLHGSISEVPVLHRRQQSIQTFKRSLEKEAIHEHIKPKATLMGNICMGVLMTYCKKHMKIYRIHGVRAITGRIKISGIFSFRIIIVPIITCTCRNQILSITNKNPRHRNKPVKRSAKKNQESTNSSRTSDNRWSNNFGPII